MNFVSNQANALLANSTSSNPALVVDPEQITLGGAVDGKPVRFTSVNIVTPPKTPINGRWFTKVYRIQGSASADGLSFAFNKTFSLGQTVTNVNGAVSTSGSAIESLRAAVSATQNYQATHSSYLLNEFVTDGDTITEQLQLLVEPNGTPNEAYELSYATNELFLPCRMGLTVTKSDEFSSSSFAANSRDWYSSSANNTTSATWFGQPVAMQADSGLSFNLAITAEHNLPII